VRVGGCSGRFVAKRGIVVGVFHGGGSREDQWQEDQGMMSRSSSIAVPGPCPVDGFYSFLIPTVCLCLSERASSKNEERNKKERRHPEVLTCHPLLFNPKQSSATFISQPPFFPA
jgi:hypothetical protein